MCTKKKPKQFYYGKEKCGGIKYLHCILLADLDPGLIIVPEGTPDHYLSGLLNLEQWVSPLHFLVEPNPNTLWKCSFINNKHTGFIKLYSAKWNYYPALL